MFLARKAVLPAAEVSSRTAEPTLRLTPETGTTSDWQAVRHGNDANDNVVHELSRAFEREQADRLAVADNFPAAAGGL